MLPCENKPRTKCNILTILMSVSEQRKQSLDTVTEIMAAEKISENGKHLLFLSKINYTILFFFIINFNQLNARLMNKSIHFFLIYNSIYRSLYLPI